MPEECNCESCRRDRGEKIKLLKLEGFPYCCTALIIVRFDAFDTDETHCIRDMKAEIKELVFKAKYSDNPDAEFPEPYDMGFGTVVAMVTSLQTHAIKALKRSGFKQSKPMTKDRHEESELILFWVSVDKFVAKHEAKLAAPLVCKEKKK